MLIHKEEDTWDILKQLVQERVELDDKIHQLEVKLSAQKPSTCPRCASTLVTRTNSKLGKQFIGCSQFPTCRYSREF